MTKASYKEISERRIALIRKKAATGLSGAEYQELCDIEDEVGAYIDARHPLPTIAELERIVER